MVKKIAIGLLLIVVGLAAFIATRPAAFRYERSAQIDAPADVVFGLVADFHQWEKWSPWEKLDLQMKKTHSGAASGVGASYAWAGNNDVGEGRMTVTEAKAPEKLVIKLEFLKPMTATNTSSFTLKQSGGTTAVTWAMEGNNDFVAKAFSTFVDMDKMIGSDFEKGLKSLKELAEAEAKSKASAAATVPAAAPKP